MIELAPDQIKALKELGNGRILCGPVGSGKSRVALAYFMARVAGAGVKINGHGTEVAPSRPIPLFIITTAKKRDTLEWESELARFGLMPDDSGGWLGRPIVIDSWNNLPKYKAEKDAMFIFDEQRLVGSGAWVRTFYKIARRNKWILLSGTPGDTWSDYIPVFIANGFYPSKAEFLRKHAVYNVYANYPKIDRWVDEKRLVAYRSALLVEIDYKPHTTRHMVTVPCQYDHDLMEKVVKKRWHILEERPIKDAGELFRLMRRVSNTHSSRATWLTDFYSATSTAIIFYSFNYELKMLRDSLTRIGVTVAEWNGHRHDTPPTKTSSPWAYLVQYTAGSEGWNCTSTDTVIFWSLTYSYRAFEQAQGRIDRRDTPFRDLYYYVLRSDSAIDKAVWSCLLRKKSFNEASFIKKHDEFKVESDG